MKNHSQAITALILVACCAPWLSSSCSRGSSADNPPPVTVEKAPDLTLVEAPDPEQFPLTTVEQRAIYDELKVNGVVTPDVNRSVSVLSLAGGRVADIRAKLGDDVTKSQVLLRINSPEVAQAFADYQKAQADEVLARRQQERSETLLAKGAIAQRDLEAAEDAEQKAKVDLATAAERLRVLGADINQPSPIVEVKAPISGTIVEQNVTGGTGVRSMDNSPNLFTIADLSRVWVLCDVYENNLSQVRLGGDLFAKAGDRLVIVLHRDPTGRNGVDSNSLVRQLHGKSTCVGDNRAFGRCVQRVLGGTLQAVDRSQIADCTTALPQHMLHHPLGQKELRPDIHVEQHVKLLVCNLEKRTIEGNACVVHQAVQAAQELNRVVGQADAFVNVIKVRLEARGSAAQGFDFVDRRLCPRITVGIVQNHVRPLPGKLQGYLTPYPCARPGHQRFLARQPPLTAHL